MHPLLYYLRLDVNITLQNYSQGSVKDADAYITAGDSPSLKMETRAMWQLLRRTRPTTLPRLFSTLKRCAAPRTTTAELKKLNLSSPRKAPAIVSIGIEDGPETLKSSAYGGEQWTPQWCSPSSRQAIKSMPWATNYSAADLSPAALLLNRNREPPALPFPARTLQAEGT
jgi:hypothetical protein